MRQFCVGRLVTVCGRVRWSCIRCFCSRCVSGPDGFQCDPDGASVRESIRVTVDILTRVIDSNVLFYCY